MSAKQRVDLLITGGIVVTMNPDRRVLNDGAVAIVDDRIVAVGPSAVIAPALDAARVMDASRRMVLPGLIDCHAHAGHALLKTIGAEQRDDWSDACEIVYTTGSSEAFWAADAALAALERLRFGVTTGLSMFGGGDSIMRTDDPIYGDRHCEAYERVGVRSYLAVGPTRPPHPRLYAQWEGATRSDQLVPFERQLEVSETLIQRWHGRHNQRINIMMMAPTMRDEHILGADAATRDLICAQTQAARAISRAHGVPFTQDGHTRGSVRFAESLRLLGPDAILSHATDLAEDEIEICARTGTRIAHNPSAIASILGRCPVPELLDAGVIVGLGSDGTAPDRSGDMFRHMVQCMHYHRTRFKDPRVLPPGKVLEMATIDAAHVLGLGDLIGSIEVGKKADLILIDLDRPHLYPRTMPLFQVIYYANGNDVDTVIVDGRILMEGRVVRSVDERAILDDAHREAEIMLDRAGLRTMLKTPSTFWKHSHY
jgi:cytosine/adenosine deaminase-related metal-dependent hydrolase